MAPSGGPTDEIPPTLIYQYPQTADVLVPTDAKIEIIFSEWIDPKNTSQSITIFPILKDGFDVRVSGKKVIIKPNTAFEDSTTYHVGLSTELSDVHKVNINKPLDIIFSTGPVIDTLSISGCIPDPERGKSQPRVALFKYDKSILNDTVLLGYPSYLSQTDSLGKFEFTHIKSGKYFILAFEDNNKDNKLSAGSEKAYTYPKQFVEAGNKEELHLFYTWCDTSVNKISNVKAISPQLLTAELNKPYLKSDQYSNHINLKINIADSTKKEIKIKEVLYSENEKKILFSLKDSLTLEQHKLTYTINRAIPFFQLDSTSKDSLLIADSTFYDTLTFNGTNKSDSLNIKFINCAPLEEIPINEPLTINWTGLVKPRVDQLLITDTSGDTTFLTIEKTHSNKTVLTPKRDLLAGTMYTLHITDTQFVDLNENYVIINEPIDTSDTTLSDSLIELSLKDKGKISFTTIASLQICNSLSLIPKCSDISSKGTALTYRYLDSKKELSTPFNGKGFLFNNIPEGNGVILWFKDLNNNLKRDPGNLFPWNEPEFLYSFSDTVEARGHWDIENVPLKECITCNALNTATIQQDSDIDRKK